MRDIVLGICIPVLNERERLPALLAGLDAAVGAVPEGAVCVAVGDNGSTDGSFELLQVAASTRPYLRLARTFVRGPGHARTAAARLLAAGWQGLDPARCWVLACDADNIVAANHVASWTSVLASAGRDVLVTGSYSLAGDPVAELVGGEVVADAWSDTVRWCEDVVGVVNPTGANHAVRLDALESAGWYSQPLSDVVGQGVVVAGDDWDLGVRLRLGGASTRRVPIVVTTSSRRFLADPTAYLTGAAHDGEFRRVDATGGRPLAPLPAPTRVRARAVSHFFLKPVLLGLEVDWVSVRFDLSQELTERLRPVHHSGRAAWDRSRDEFVYGLLAGHERLAHDVAEALGRAASL